MSTSYSVENAKSNRSMCKTCKVKIGMGEVRLGTSVPGPGDFMMTSWRHITCAKRPSGLTADALGSLDALSAADQTIVRAWLAGDAASLQSYKRKSDEAAAEAAFSTPTKKPKAAAAATTPTTTGGKTAAASGIGIAWMATTSVISLAHSARGIGSSG